MRASGNDPGQGHCRSGDQLEQHPDKALFLGHPAHHLSPTDHPTGMPARPPNTTGATCRSI